MKQWLALIAIPFFTLQVSGQELLWSEEFSGRKLDPQVWNFELGDGCPELCGWGNNERQVYTKRNHRLENGKLIITARLEDSLYTSTRITTQGKKVIQYGRVEARIKLPRGKGLWPAFWMLGSNIKEVGWPRCGEIDIMEYVGRAPGQVFTSLHTAHSHGNTINSKQTAIASLEEGFHTFAVDWSPEQIAFYVDGKLAYTFAPRDRSEAVWPFDQPFYLLLNLAVGGNFGGPEVDDSIFPQEYVVDYIRLYARE